MYDEQIKSCILNCPELTVLTIEQSKFQSDIKVQICRKCSNHCLSCTSLNVCSRCKEGYYALDNLHGGNSCDPCDGHSEFLKFTMNGQCFVCHENCKTCYGSRENNCMTCKDPESLVNFAGECVSNDSKIKFASGGFMNIKPRIEINLDREFIHSKPQRCFKLKAIELTVPYTGPATASTSIDL